MKMKRLRKGFLCAAMMLLLTLVLPMIAKPFTAEAASASIKLSASKKSIKAGLSFKLKTTVTGDSTSVTWTSSNTSVAKVNKNGKVTAKKPGTVVIKATANGKTAKCKVTVKENPAGKIKTGMYSTYTAESSASDDVVVLSAKNGKIKFVVEHYGAYGDPMYYTNTITAVYNNNKVSSFKWTDSWGNSGTGKLVFGTNKVTVTMKATSTSMFNRWGWDAWTNNKKTISYSRKLTSSEKKAYADTGVDG
ncbi:MAG: Ig-like domain-containing protein [Clostridiales bacterium]|nr:Ig-like domain-containing protein [Clostridiales bacterium]